jgi:hypothetical protein
VDPGRVAVASAAAGVVRVVCAWNDRDIPTSTEVDGAPLRGRRPALR